MVQNVVLFIFPPLNVSGARSIPAYRWCWSWEIPLFQRPPHWDEQRRKNDWFFRRKPKGSFPGPRIPLWPFTPLPAVTPSLVGHCFKDFPIGMNREEKITGSSYESQMKLSCPESRPAVAACLFPRFASGSSGWDVRFQEPGWDVRFHMISSGLFRLGRQGPYLNSVSWTLWKRAP